MPSSQISTGLKYSTTRLPVASRIKYLLIVTFKALRTGTPGYLSDLLRNNRRIPASDAPDRLVVPLYSGERSEVHVRSGIVYQQT